MTQYPKCRKPEEVVAMPYTGSDLKRLRFLRAKANKARRFPVNTCGASRHLQMMADQLASLKPYPMVIEEPQHVAESIYSVLISLWAARDRLASLASMDPGQR